MLLYRFTWKGRGPERICRKGLSTGKEPLHYFCSQPKNVDVIVAAHEEHNKNTQQYKCYDHRILWLIDITPGLFVHISKIMLVAIVLPPKDERVKGLALA